MEICPRLLIVEPSDHTLRIFRGYDCCIFLILIFLDRSFWVFHLDLRAVCLVMECPPPLLGFAGGFSATNCINKVIGTLSNRSIIHNFDNMK